MVTLKITKKGFVNQLHGHKWDVMVGMIAKALNNHKNPFHNNETKNKRKANT